MVRFDLAIPLFNSGLLPVEVFVAMAFLTGVFEAELLIESRPRNGNAVIGASEYQGGANRLMLQIGHVAADAEIAQRIGLMVGVRRWIDRFAGVATGALGIVEAAMERLAKDIAITLG